VLASLPEWASFPTCSPVASQARTMSCSIQSIELSEVILDIQALPMRALLVAVHAHKHTPDDAPASVAQHLRGHWHIMKVD
jgi:hypothetical protein